MSVDLSITAHCWWSGVRLKVAWGNSWFVGRIMLPFCRLALTIERAARKRERRQR